ncbi:protein of unknown function [Tepidibacter aestuarii]|nr:protein of unknown function [Tepidibacter aestuarii]
MSPTSLTTLLLKIVGNVVLSSMLSTINQSYNSLISKKYTIVLLFSCITFIIINSYIDHIQFSTL